MTTKTVYRIQFKDEDQDNYPGWLFTSGTEYVSEAMASNVMLSMLDQVPAGHFNDRLRIVEITTTVTHKVVQNVRSVGR